MKNIKYLAYITMMLLVSVASNAQEREFLRNGNDKYENKDFTESEIDYRKAINENQNSVTGHYNLGNSIFNQDRNEEAIAEYDLVAKQAKNKVTKANAYHNKGNALMKDKKFDEAVEAYKNSLRNNPTDEETRYNLAVAKKELKKQQQQQQENKDNKGDKNKDGENNKDNENKEGKDNKDKEDDKKDDKKDQNKKDKEDDKKDKDNDKKDQDKKDKEKDKKDDKKDKGTDKKGEPKKGQISKSDMQRLLKALENQENETQKKVNAKKMKGKKVKGDKDW
ncbi:MAG: tetratricopeptide repeat protein [Ichthyobacteriaceae bacterium]|nr:tetratricopeptide repeat protein [Ichthyobacteriaceae bacterium]